MVNSDGWLLLSMLFFLAVLAWTIRYAIRKQSGLLDPVFIFLFFYTLYILPFALRTYLTKDTGYTTKHLLLLLNYIPIGVFLCALALPLFVWGYYSTAAKRLARRMPVPPINRSPGLAFGVFGGISVLLIIQLAQSAGGLLSFVLLGYNVTAEMVGKGYLVIGFPWLFTASFFLLYGYAVQKRKVYLFAFVVSFGIVLLLHILMWRRNEMVFMIMAIGLFCHHAIRPIKLRTLALSGTVLYVVLTLAAGVRTSNYESVSSFLFTSATRIDQATDEKHGILYTLTTGDFLYPFETVPQMIKSVGTEVAPRFGITYLRAPVFLLPMKLYPQRPLSVAQWYMQQFYGNGFGLNEGTAFFFVAEGYLNFGPVGPFITLLFWGMLCGLVQNYRVRAADNPGAVLLYALFVAFLLQAIRGEATSLIIGFPAQWLGPAVIGLWVIRTGKGKRKLAGRAVSKRIGTVPLPE
jgi:oligosaccharide repeat unit polymerase